MRNMFTGPYSHQSKINTHEHEFFFSFSHNGGHDANIKYGDKRKKKNFPTYSFQPRKIINYQLTFLATF